MLVLKNQLIAMLLFLTVTVFSQADKKVQKEMSRELGLNVTSLLADLLGNNNRTDAGQYLLSFKKLTGTSAFRLGLGINFNLSSQNNGFRSTLLNQNFQVRMGKEWRHDLNAKLQYYFGVDGVGGFSTEESSATISGGSIIQKNRDFLVGAGPVLGFQYAIFDKLLLGTEGSLYATFIGQNTSFSQNFFNGGVPPPVPPTRKNQGISVKTNLPTSLFLILKF